MEFEFNPKKSDKNKQKHGIDFYEAQLMWDDPDRIEIRAENDRRTKIPCHRNDRGKVLVGRHNIPGQWRKNNLGTKVSKRGD